MKYLKLTDDFNNELQLNHDLVSLNDTNVPAAQIMVETDGNSGWIYITNIDDIKALVEWLNNIRYEMEIANKPVQK